MERRGRIPQLTSFGQIWQAMAGFNERLHSARYSRLFTRFKKIRLVAKIGNIWLKSTRFVKMWQDLAKDVERSGSSPKTRSLKRG